MESTLSIPASLAIDALALDLRSAMTLASQAGFAGIAMANNRPDIATPDFGHTARRHLRHLLMRDNLRLTHLRAASVRGGLFNKKSLDRIMASALEAFRMAHELGAPSVGLYMGSPQVAATTNSEIPDSVLDSARLLANEADKAGVQLALSGESGDILGRTIASLGAGHVVANLDVARMAADADALLQVADRLGDAIGIWTLSDAVRSGRSLRPVELGQGYLPLAEILARTNGLGGRVNVIVDVRDLPDPQHAALVAADMLRTVQGGLKVR